MNTLMYRPLHYPYHYMAKPNGKSMQILINIFCTKGVILISAFDDPSLKLFTGNYFKFVNAQNDHVVQKHGSSL